MVVCPHCGEENPQRARFCLACGAELAVDASGGEERKVVSVLFVDLVGFTRRSDMADPEDVRATLRPYHERVKADVERFGGTVEKFIGDGVMAVFGAPVAHEDDAERAVRSALRVLETIDDLRADGLEIAARAAVTTGEAVVALGARPERGEGIVTGDVVNTASRLQSAAPVGAVIVDEATMRSTEGAIAFEELAAVEAKGKAEPIAVWRALRARSRVGPPEASVQTPFVGREHERTLLLETFLRAERESSVQLVTVVGEPGIGKSRLVTELRAALDDRPDLITWRHGRCLPYGEGITFWALGEIVKAEAGVLESDDPQLVASKLEETVASLFADESERAWFVSRLAPLVGASGDGGAVSRDEVFTAWRRFLEAMAEQRSCVLVVEDLHWADGPLLEFLEHLLDWSTNVPLLVLCTARPELFVKQPSWGGGKRNATTISLAPLSTEEALRLLQALLDRAVLPAETQAVLLERAGGNPLYAEQFARMLADRSDIGELGIPETLQALMAARLDTLPAELKAVLHDAAVVGRVFWNGAVASIGGHERGNVRRRLNELVRREFVRPVRVSSIEGEDEFSFWHALARDVAYQQIPRAPRAAKHVAAATWIEGMAGERLEDQAEILVHHYTQALDLAEAAGQDTSLLREKLPRLLMLAGDRAMHLDVAAAEDAYRRAASLSNADPRVRAMALTKQATALIELGETLPAISMLEEVIPDLLAAGDEQTAGVATFRRARASWFRGDTDRAREASLQAIELLERAPGGELVNVYGFVSFIEAAGARDDSALDEALRWFELGIQAASEHGVDDVVRLLAARGTVRGYRGDPGSLDDLQASLDVAQRLGLGLETAIGFNNLGSATQWYGSVADALRLYDDGIEASHRRGLTSSLVWVRGERLASLFEAGRWEEVEREARDLLGGPESPELGQIEVLARAHLAKLLSHRGEIDEAREHRDLLLPQARTIGDLQILVPALESAVLVAAAVGESADALEHASELERLTCFPGWRVACLTAPLRVCVGLGELGLAERMLEGVDTPRRRYTSATAAARGLLAEARGRLDEASQLYREAAEGWEVYGSVVEQAYALLGLGRCGDASALREGQALFERLDAAPVFAKAA